MHRLRKTLITGLLVLAAVPATGQESTPAASEAASQEATGPAIPPDAFNRGTPRRSVEGFLKAIEANDYQAAAEYLDLRNLPRRHRDDAPAQLARELGVVITRELWINMTELSDSPEGTVGDGLPGYRDELGRLQTEQGEIVLLLQRVPRGDGVFIWKVSNATVAKIADLYDDFGYGPIVEAVAKRLPEISFLGLELFKWVLALGAGLIAYPILLLLAWLLTRFRSAGASPTRDRLFRFFAGPVAVIIVVLIMNAVVYSLGLGVTARKIAEGRTLLIIASTWLIVASITLIRDVMAIRLERQGRAGTIVLLRPAAGAIKAIVIVAAALTWLDNIGYNITTLLASLGIGGVAVALALQKPLEDVFGAFTLYTQQPIRIGDFCRFGDQTGTVEEIGLRTTRVRTLNNTVVSIPNSRFAGEHIENISARQKILYRPTLRLRYDTAPATMRAVLKGIEDLLASHEHVIQDNPRVRFRGFATDALEIEIFAYLETTKWSEYLELAEDLNLRIIDIIATAGTSLAVPMQTLQIEQ